MTKELPRCLWCGADLVESPWNQMLSVLICTASGCEKFRHVQMKRYYTGFPEGRLEQSRWILNSRREHWR